MLSWLRVWREPRVLRWHPQVPIFFVKAASAVSLFVCAEVHLELLNSSFHENVSCRFAINFLSFLEAITIFNLRLSSPFSLCSFRELFLFNAQDTVLSRVISLCFYSS